MNDVWGAKHTHPLGFKQHPARKMLGFLYHSYSHQFSFNELRLTAFTRVRPLNPWAGGRGVIHPTPPPSNPSSHQLHFERHPWHPCPPKICWRDMLDHGSWTNFNIHKKKNTDWIISNQLRICILSESCFSVFSSWSSPCVECQLEINPTSLIAREAGFVFTVQTCSSKYLIHLKLRLWLSCGSFWVQMRVSFTPQRSSVNQPFRGWPWLVFPTHK